MPNETDTLRVLVFCGAEGLFAPAIEALSGEAFAVERTGSVYSGIAGFAQNPADVAVIDVDALDDEAMDCLRVLRDIKADVRILVVFTQRNRLRAAKALERGADAMLQQPFYPAEFCAIVRRWAQPEPSAAGVAGEEEHRASLARMALGIAHEINNPLCTLSGWLQMMELDDDRSEEECRRFASMREEADRIAQVVRNLLAFGEEPPCEHAPVNVDQLLAGIAGELKERASHVRIEADLAAPEARVSGDSDLISRALRLLMEDALAACGGEGRITVSSRPSGRVLKVRVRDDGERLPEDAFDTLFEPFRHMPRAGESFALAYPAVKGIARAHGGDVSVSGDDAGTEFLLTLPLQSSRTRETVS